MKVGPLAPAAATADHDQGRDGRHRRPRHRQLHRRTRTALKNLGMQVVATDATSGIVEGYPADPRAADRRRPAPDARDRPDLHAVQAGRFLAERGRPGPRLPTRCGPSLGLDGTGVQVGVLSDSVNLYDNPNVAGRRPAGVDHHRRPARGRRAGAAGPGPQPRRRAHRRRPRDAGADPRHRPGLDLSFHTAFGGPVLFANGIRALAQNGAEVIVDDVGNLLRAVLPGRRHRPGDQRRGQRLRRDLLRRGGQLVGLRLSVDLPGAPTARSPGVGTGRFQDFDPGPGQSLTLPITPRFAGGPLVFQWDNPIDGITADLDIFLLDANNAIVAQATTNNIATQGVPLEALAIPATATQVAIRINPGSPDVGHIFFSDPFSDSVADLAAVRHGGRDVVPVGLRPHRLGREVDQRRRRAVLGRAGLRQPAQPDRNEAFSSFGPGLRVFDSAGNVRPTSQQAQQTPQLSAPDGNNTSFFYPHNRDRHDRPAGAHRPGDDDELRPRHAAELLRHLVGRAEPGGRRRADEAARADGHAGGHPQRDDHLDVPLNGTAKGQWDPQGGYGLVQAAACHQRGRPAPGGDGHAGQRLDGHHLAAAIVVTFSRAVDPATVQAERPDVHAVPHGRDASTVGTPDADQRHDLRLPARHQHPAGVKANGAYVYIVRDRVGHLDRRDRRQAAGAVQRRRSTSRTSRRRGSPTRSSSAAR